MSSSHSVRFTIDDKTMQRNLRKLSKESPEMLQRAFEKLSITLLGWMNDGSPNSPKKPPIRWAVLRASSSVLVNGRVVGFSEIRPERGIANPVTSSGMGRRKKYYYVAELVWNTPYAARMHNGHYNLGPKSVEDPGSGPGWVPAHLIADKSMFMEGLGEEIKDALNKL